MDRCCNDNGEKTETVAAGNKAEPTKTIQKSTAPISFYKEKFQAVKGDNFKAYKDSIVATLADGKILEITGYYQEGEVNNSDKENLGIARASEIRKLFPEIPDERIRLFGKKKNTIDNGEPFVASSFNSAVNNANVKEIDNSALIYFPYNSTRKLSNPKIDVYLDDVAQRVTKSGEKVYLTGHTDGFGPDDANYNLGLSRANKVKEILIAKGVPAKNIIVKSAGEKSPIASNNTSAGRAKNRRVELKILK